MLDAFRGSFSPSLPGRGETIGALPFYIVIVSPVDNHPFCPYSSGFSSSFAFPYLFQLLPFVLLQPLPRQGKDLDFSVPKQRVKKETRQNRHEESASARHAKAPPKSLSRPTLTH
ncbi:hypothetical protein H0G86_004257 [Trichoderma simmonsii]|uniref:Uncharacterized protein n=1 Tax=Trichoderma simmonsii TaxID=1491479 RepID=A0A8G0PDZ5_9HYPO|nr:hypothetical protein H0G86_004257 [Trichoderma simmonsii]